MSKLVIRFVNSDGFIGKSIDWTTNSLFDHVEARSITGGWIGAHNKGGIQDRPVNYMNPSREYIYGLPVSETDYNIAQSYAQSMIGTKYNFEDIFGLLVHDRRYTNPHSLICSQFMINYLFKASLQPLNVLPDFTYLISPETLHLSPIFIGNLISKKG